MTTQVQKNNVELCPRFDELERLCPVLLLIASQIMSFMFIAANMTDAQYGLQGHCVLVPTDTKNFQNILPRSCDEES